MYIFHDVTEAYPESAGQEKTGGPENGRGFPILEDVLDEI
jgi:hypothetical protein